MKTKPLAVLAACMTLSSLLLPPAFAQTVEAYGSTSSGLFATSTYGRMPRDFSGVIWGGVPPKTPVIFGSPAKEAPLAQAFGAADRAEWIKILQPWAREIVERYKVLEQSPHAPLDPPATCHPTNMPGLFVLEGAAAIQFLISPKVILMVHEYGNQTRIIYMDQEHPKTLKPHWLGHSVGKWDGDTLVVDTIGYNDLSALAGGSVVHTTQLHTIERVRLIDVGRKLEYKVTYDDPGSLLKPYEKTLVYLPARDQGSPIQERGCEDNNMPVPMASDATAGKG